MAIRSRLALSALLVSTVVGLASGCSTAPTGSGVPVTPRDLLLDRPPTGFKQTLDTVLPIANASSVLATDAARTGPQLSAFGYSDGAERAWTGSAGEYATAIVFEFNSTVSPGNFMAFFRNDLKARPSVTLFTDGGEPGALGFDLYGLNRAGNAQVFCQGSMFALTNYMFQLEDCAAGPRYAAAPLTMARGQYERAARLLGQPITAPSTPSG